MIEPGDFRTAAELLQARNTGNRLAHQAILAKKANHLGIIRALEFAIGQVTPLRNIPEQLREIADQLEYRQWKAEQERG